MRNAAIVLGLIFALVALVYWLVPAEAGGTRIHVKHGVAAAVVAVILFAFAWYAGRSRA